MAEEPGKPGEWVIPVDDANGGKDRATVALVDAKMDGLKALVQAEFGFIREKIAPLTAIPDRLARLEAKHDALGERVIDLEQAGERHRDWRRAAVTTAVMAAIGLLFNLGITFHWF